MDYLVRWSSDGSETCEKNSQIKADASMSWVTLPRSASCTFEPPGQEWPPPSMR